MNRPKLGDWCIVSGYTWKVHKDNAGKTLERGVKRKPSEFPIETCWKAEPSTPVKMMFIGWRIMPMGKTRMETDGDEFTAWSYPVFKQTGTVEVWMFVESARQNMVYALPEQVQFEAQSE